MNKVNIYAAWSLGGRRLYLVDADEDQNIVEVIFSGAAARSTFEQKRSLIRGLSRVLHASEHPTQLAKQQETDQFRKDVENPPEPNEALKAIADTPGYGHGV